jgi:hypothetical protein
MFGPPPKPLFCHGWASGEFLFWSTRGVTPPALVTTGPNTGVAGTVGQIGQPGTQILFGNERILQQMRPGFRVELGAYWGEDGRYGISARYFQIGHAAEEFIGSSGAQSVVNLPQFTPNQVTQYIGFPGTTFGTVSIHTNTYFLGGELDLRRRMTTRDGFNLDLLGGYRYLHLGDSLSSVFQSATTGFANAATPNTVGSDIYSTRNDFHGGQVGFAAGGRSGRWSFDVRGAISLGATVTELDASHSRIPATGSVPTPGAAVQTAGSFQSSYFAVVPELGVKVG